ncbi:macrolide family glycosyltransferase [Streptomyces albus]
MLPVLPVVTELVARGHRVTCFATEEFLDRVRATGARALPYDPPLSSDPPPDVVDADECARAPLKNLTSSMSVLPAVERGFADGAPDVIAYDTTLWLTGRLLALRLGRPTVQLSPTFISNEHYSLGEHHQEFAGRIDREHPAIVEFGDRLRRIAAGTGLPEERQAELFFGHEEFTVAFVPKEFQFAAETFDERHLFVGPTAGEGDGTQWQPPADGRPVLLVSLGTTVNNQPGFFRRCVEAFAELPWHTVFALGGRISPDELGPLPPHVEAHPWVPLADVLRHASVFLCQSGMGSVLESLRAGVPMVAVPHHPEQHINAKRLTELAWPWWCSARTPVWRCCGRPWRRSRATPGCASARGRCDVTSARRAERCGPPTRSSSGCAPRPWRHHDHPVHGPDLSLRPAGRVRPAARDVPGRAAEADPRAG